MEKSRRAFNKAIDIARRWHFPQIQYLVLCEMAYDSLRRDPVKKARSDVRKACKFIEEMAENIGDKILSAQFKESKFHEELLHYCRQHQLLNKENK
jgi:hypothetical protein